MPPSRLYDAITLAHTAVQVLQRAVTISIERNLPPAAYIATPRTRSSNSQTPSLTPGRQTKDHPENNRGDLTEPRETVLAEPVIIPNTWTYARPASNDLQGTNPPRLDTSRIKSPNDSPIILNADPQIDSSSSVGGGAAILDDFNYYEDAEPAVKLTPSRVPASRLGRLFHYGSLATSLAAGTATEYVRRAATGSSAGAGSPMMSEANVARLVDKLSRMRGAALKLGQFMSIQDAHVLPEQIERVLRQVQNNAHYMPNVQLEKVLVTELGPNWSEKFQHFEPIPIASASIGQVHKATVSSTVLPSTPQIALKVQFPNIAESITSDLANISALLNAGALLPRGLYLDRTLAVMRGELADECDYEREARSIEKFGDFLGRKQERFKVPKVIHELTTKRVLAMEWMEGVSIAKGSKWPKHIRDQISKDILTLCLRELFEFRFMQTDPNWSNFLYNPQTGQLQLIDFGASREYSKEFMDDWYMLLSAAVREDKEACVKYSRKLGYLTGEESKEMVDAHVRSVTLLGVPFRSTTPQPFSFEAQTVTDEIRSLIPVMLRLRLTPPPKETYSLNRKLSGAFLLCGRLGADVDCRTIWEEVVGAYKVGST